MLYLFHIRSVVTTEGWSVITVIVVIILHICKYSAHYLAQLPRQSTCLCPELLVNTALALSLVTLTGDSAALLLMGRSCGENICHLRIGSPLFCEFFWIKI